MGRGLIVDNELWHGGLFEAEGWLNLGEGAKLRTYGMNQSFIIEMLLSLSSQCFIKGKIANCSLSI